MSRTLKDKANHFRFHMRRLYWRSPKLADGQPLPNRTRGEYVERGRYDESDVPPEVKAAIEVLNYNLTGYRFGIDRKSNAKSKVIERKIKRRKDRRQFLAEVDRELAR